MSNTSDKQNTHKIKEKTTKYNISIFIYRLFSLCMCLHSMCTFSVDIIDNSLICPCTGRHCFWRRWWSYWQCFQNIIYYPHTFCYWGYFQNVIYYPQTFYNLSPYFFLMYSYYSCWSGVLSALVCSWATFMQKTNHTMTANDKWQNRHL